MASYITITDAETDPEAPLTSELAKKWRDNPIAIAEGDSAAPKISGAVNRLGNSLDVGSYVMASRGTTTTGLHDTVAGSGLQVCGVLRQASFSISNSGSSISSASGSWQASSGTVTLSGTWACRGNIGPTSSSSSGGSSTSSSLTAATLWQRVA